MLIALPAAAISSFAQIIAGTTVPKAKRAAREASDENLAAWRGANADAAARWLDAAEQEFLQRGVAKTSLEHIARRAADEGWSVRQVEDAVRARTEQQAAPRRPTARPMRPPAITPTATKKIMSSTCCAVHPLLAARRRPSHHAATKPSRYISPYQRTFSGPSATATGSISGYFSMAR